jgi:DNA-binding response OmpR family regulator
VWTFVFTAKKGKSLGVCDGTEGDVYYSFFGDGSVIAMTHYSVCEADCVGPNGNLLPDGDYGVAVERIRELSAVPVMMLTARAQELDKVRGLRAGADDYVTKPFGRQELLARVDAHLRRQPSESPHEPMYSDEHVEIDFAQRSVRAGGEEVALTPLEFKLLTSFVRNPNQVLSHEQLLQLVWGDVRGGAREQVKLYVGYLRRKLGERPDGDSPIETVRGFGYRYRA